MAEMEASLVVEDIAGARRAAGRIRGNKDRQLAEARIEAFVAGEEVAT
jgi:hypothetical protein